MSVIEPPRGRSDDASTTDRDDASATNRDDAMASLRATFPSIDLRGWHVDCHEDDVLKLTSADTGRSRTALAYYAPWADFTAFGRRVRIHPQWKAEVVCTDTHTTRYSETFDAKRDAVEGLVTNLEW